MQISCSSIHSCGSQYNGSIIAYYRGQLAIFIKIQIISYYARRSSPPQSWSAVSYDSLTARRPLGLSCIHGAEPMDPESVNAHHDWTLWGILWCARTLHPRGSGLAHPPLTLRPLTRSTGQCARGGGGGSRTNFGLFKIALFSGRFTCSLNAVNTGVASDSFSILPIGGDTIITYCERTM